VEAEALDVEAMTVVDRITKVRKSVAVLHFFTNLIGVKTHCCKERKDVGFAFPIPKLRNT